MYNVIDETPIGVLAVGQFKSLISEIIDQRVRKQNVTAVAPQKEILNMNELSEYIGQSKSHIYKLTGNFKIPYYKRSKIIYFKRSEIDEWLTEHRIRTIYEIEREAQNFILK